MTQKAFLPPLMCKQVITKPAHDIDVDFFGVTQAHNVFNEITSHKALSQKSATNESSN